MLPERGIETISPGDRTRTTQCRGPAAQNKITFVLLLQILPNESQEEVADVGMCKEELLVAGKIEEELATTTPADAE